MAEGVLFPLISFSFERIVSRNRLEIFQEMEKWIEKTARRTERLESLKKELENEAGKVTAIGCDVSDRKSVEEAFKTIEGSFESVNILVNNAGIVR
jgi:NADP-dependent 3-hydroxy acid dehydrogenase YdfG